ncbi:hypothetical protein [Stakelama marina]|uniref:Integron n=1 Tax=Stakelama marina TaxID=2826939 RepID=A0A8T4IMQ8_9SPHN|nr:hypothetical protein [Stakelama marina]MBR0553609.1 hypothetical protein [Stakelama marina]
MRTLIPVLCLFLAACNNNVTPIAADNDQAVVNNEAARPLSPGERPVRIGESGPSFAACATRGMVVDLSDGETLPVRAAPFEEAEQKGSLASGQRLFVCTRSMNQRWLGVVVPAEGGPDCGVTQRVDSPRAYAGACLSGWVSNSYVRLTGN